MKYIKTYEGLRDAMKPKSEEEINNLIKKYGEYKYVELNDDLTITVKTPIPYIVTVNYNDIKEHLLDLNNSVKFLYECFKLLNISEDDVIKNNYTLNYDTGDKLSQIARYSDIPTEDKLKIINYDW